MTRRCDSNPAQYERNRRFGHLVHVLGRSASGAKLPSVGLCLNASKAESRLVTATIPSGPLFARGRIAPRRSVPVPGNQAGGCKCRRPSPRATLQGGGPKSSVDDLCTGRGVVLGRAATTLRSIETQPFRPDDLSCQLDKSSERAGAASERASGELARAREREGVERVFSLPPLSLFFSRQSCWRGDPGGNLARRPWRGDSAKFEPALI